MDSEMPYFPSFGHYASSAWCIMQYTVCPCLASCPFYGIPIIPFLIYDIFHFLVDIKSLLLTFVLDRPKDYPPPMASSDDLGVNYQN